MSMHRTVPPSEIESALTTIWDELQGTNKMRATLFNLIILAKKDERESYLQEIAKKLIEKFPARIIFVSMGPSDGMETQVNVLSAEEGENAIACDLIHIEIGGSFKERTPFLILPHILPDLPVYLLRTDDPVGTDPVSMELEALSRRIIFDSEATCDLPLYAQTILKHRESLHTDIADLNWARFEEWRTLLAGTFHTKDRLLALTEARQIVIEYNALSSKTFCHTKTQAIYLALWLGQRLDWTLKNVLQNQELTFEYENSKIDLKPTETKDLPPGRIVNIEIHAPGDEIFSLKRHEKLCHHVMIERSTPTICEIPTEFIFDKESGLSLVKEICHKGTSTHFKGVLEILSNLDSEALK